MLKMRTRKLRKHFLLGTFTNYTFLRGAYISLGGSPRDLARPHQDLRRSSEGREHEGSSCLHSHIVVANLQVEEKAKKMREHITKEILSTEKTYVENLSFMIKVDNLNVGK